MTNRQNSNNELYYVSLGMKIFFFVSARNLPARAQNLIVSTTKQRAVQLTTAPRLRINVRRTRIEIHCNPKNLSPRTTSRAHTFVRAGGISADNSAKGENDRQLFQRGMGINHRQNRPFASDGRTRAFVRSFPRAPARWSTF